MTRKEIEKRCMEEMQQTIPNPEALWQRIESQLPEQTAEQPQKPVIRMHTARRVMTIAACLLVVVSGATFFAKPSGLHQNSETIMQDEQESAEAPAGNKSESAFEEKHEDVLDDVQMNDVVKTEQESEQRTYASLGLPQNTAAVDTAKLSAGTQLFEESAVLSLTECFVDVQVLQSTQHTDGEMEYLLEVVDAYGADIASGTQLSLTSKSPYFLQTAHEYVLPLYQNAENWQLVNAAAPQLELTPAGELVYHNGWKSLKHADAQPLLYAKYGVDDYFYDRMYITEDAVLFAFLAEWEASRL
ncbi:MAG: hypothetical protein E7502_06335 [Ruminococcus sp.]|nr:hypothetical protein [Ruminococcus sp.]